jgi:hypothetical protein
MADLFKIALKNKYRFYYCGRKSVEDLFDLTPAQLNEIYKNLKEQQRANAGESLMETPCKEDKVLDNMIEIVKMVYEDKQKTIEKARKAAARKQKNQRILELIANKEDEALQSKSTEELRKMLEEDAEEIED